jgi:hypothetical protein
LVSSVEGFVGALEDGSGMVEPGPWSCRKAEVDALAHPERIVNVKKRKKYTLGFTEKELNRSEKLAGRRERERK